VAAAAGLLGAPAAERPAAQVRLADASDREAFRAWFVLLVDAQFYRPTPDVTDCAALIRHGVREALRPHTPEWVRLARLPVARLAPDVRGHAEHGDGVLRLFRVAPVDAGRFAEFADARTIVGLNATPQGRRVEALQPGDLLYFRQPGQALPDHLMVFVGRSAFEPEHDDWVVYHTGPSRPRHDRAAPDPGEVRKVRLSDLLRHPARLWRPAPGNPAFVGVFRLDTLDNTASSSR
jgi:hypothetical protein